METRREPTPLGWDAALTCVTNLCRTGLPAHFGGAALVPGLEEARGLLSPRTATMHAAVRASVWATLGDSMPENLEELRDRLELAVSAAYYAVPRVRPAGQDGNAEPKAAA
jgi:hypothetical protein